MRRPPGLWILLSAGVVWLSLQNAHGLRATSLIFGKTTTTTTTTVKPVSEEPEAAEDETATTDLSNDPNATKPTLTGNPQLDYIWDPNLPQELNGYNLSDYPFYERVPEDIDFKCDGLHDGFYASVAHKCQVYHHCLFGTRYDFLCANYTAFDQTLFNCNFVSNVDCENSKNFWHRNDELYIEKSTTTVAPAINYNFYTPPPQGSPLTPSPIGAPLQPQEAPIPRRQASLRPRGTRPPTPAPALAPARPLYDYYDDYEELPRPKSRKRPRPRPRPVYYDDYEEYDDLRVTRRGGGRRRPYSRRDRPTRRNKDRRIDYEDDYVYEDDDIVLGKKQNAKRRKLLDDYEYEDDTRYEKRRAQNRRSTKPPRKKLPADDYDYEEDERLDRRKFRDENRDRLPSNTDNKKTPRLGKRRPPSQEYEDDLQQADEPQSYDTPRKSNKEKSSIKPPEDGRPIIKPVSGTIYDRPRVAPRINLPVPKNAADKYAYKSIGSPTTPVAKVAEEEYDDYEETAPQAAPNDKKTASSRLRTSKVKEDNQNPPQSKPKADNSPTNEKKTMSDLEDDYEDESLENPAIKTDKSTTATTEPSIPHSSMPVIRKFKRPFLPSRGGNPYSARNLQPVGTKAKDDTQEIDLGESSVMKSVADPDQTKNDNDQVKDTKQIPLEVKSPLVTKVTITTTAEESTLRSAVQEIAKDPKQGLIRIKVPIRVKPYTDQEESRFGPKYSVPESTTTTEQTKLAKEDILNGNYDVTLNEAISPIIPNLPVRSFGGYNPVTDYSYKRFQRPTKYVILDPVVSAGSTYYVR